MTLTIDDYVFIGTIIFLLLFSAFDYIVYYKVNKLGGVPGKFTYESLIDEIIVVAVVIFISFVLLKPQGFFVEFETIAIMTIVHLLLTTTFMYRKVKWLSPFLATSLYIGLLFLDKEGYLTIAIDVLVKGTY